MRSLTNYALSKDGFNIEVRKARADAYDKLGKHELAQKERKELDADFSEAFSNAPFRTK